MGEPVMLKEEDVVRIGDYVKPWLRELVDHVVPRAETVDVPAALLERMVRVEEELKALRVLMDERFGFMERRFEAVDKRFEAVDKRFEDMNKRFEDLIGHIDKRFETVDKRFNTLTWMIGVGFVVITSLTTVFALLA